MCIQTKTTNKRSTPKQKEKKTNKKISKKCSDKAKSGWIKEEYPKMKRVNNKNAITKFFRSVIVW